MMYTSMNPPPLASNIASTSATHTPKELVRLAIEANQAHQYALTKYTERLEDELLHVDKLLKAAEILDQDDEPDLDVGGTVYVPGAKKAVGPVTPSDLLSPSSPFFDEASKRMQYLRSITMRPMKANELEALAEAVKSENRRLQALESQRRGYGALSENVTGTIDISRNTKGLDWQRIAEKMSQAASVPRTADECRIRWLGDQHPDINHEPWTPSELEKLASLVSDKRGGQINWVDIARELGTNRVPIDCMRHAIPKPHHNWDAESDKRLLDAVQVYGHNNWNVVAMHVAEDATAGQCQARYFRSLDPTIKRGTWSEEEDSRLRLAVTEYGNSWMDVASVMPGRTNDQCRERWINSLDPAKLKDKWTDEEDRSLVEAVKDLGNKWKAISVRLGNGSSDSQCRKRYDKLRKLDPQLPVASAVASKSGTRSAKSRPSEQITDEPSGSAINSLPRSPRPETSVQMPGHSAETTIDSDPLPNEPAVRPRPKPKPRFKNKGKEREIDTPTDSHLDDATALGSGAIPGATAPAAAINSDGSVQGTTTGSPASDPHLLTSPTKGRKRRAAEVSEMDGILAKKARAKPQSNDNSASGNTETPSSKNGTTPPRAEVSSTSNTNSPKPGRSRKTAHTQSHEGGEGGVQHLSATKASPRKTQGRFVESATAKESMEGRGVSGDANASRPKPKPRGRPKKTVPPADEGGPVVEGLADTAGTARVTRSPEKAKDYIDVTRNVAVEPGGVGMRRRQSSRLSSKRQDASASADAVDTVEEP